MLTIGQVAARAGLRVSALRYYEDEGLIPKAYRKAGRRMYEHSILDRLALIELAKNAGFGLREIRDLVAGLGHGESAAEAWSRFAAAKRADLDGELARVAGMKATLEALTQCGCRTLDECGRAFRERGTC